MKAGLLAVACAGLPLKSVLGRSRAATLAAVPGSDGAELFTSASSASVEQLGYYTKSAFAPYVNTRFRVFLNSKSTRSLQLVEVQDCPGQPSQVDAGANSPGAECFSLLFTMPPGKPFTQDTYMIEHDALGTFYLFLVPVGTHSKTRPDYYEAVLYRRSQMTGAKESAITTDSNPQASQPAQEPWQVSAPEGKQGVYNFSVLLPPPPDVSGKLPERPASVEAPWMTMAQDRGVSGIKLGMTAAEILALFPGSKDDEGIRSSLARPNEFGLSNLVIKPQNYSSKADFEGINQIILTLMDGRVSTLYVSYDAPVVKDLDSEVTKFSKGKKLPPAQSWEVFVGLDDQLKTMKCADFKINVFAGGQNVPFNYVQMQDTVAQKKLRQRVVEAERRRK